MGFFNEKKKIGLFADVIRCDESSYLIWKWHPTGTQQGEHKREYGIRWGSSLRVKDGEVAVFVYKQKDGKMQDYIVGPYDDTIKTANFPILSGIVGAFFGGDTPFQAEVYFINLANIIQVKFVVPYFDVCDFRYPDFTVPIAVRGTISFKIADYREFIKLHRLESFDLNAFQNQIRDAVSRYVRNSVANAPSTYNIPVIQIETKSALINDSVETELAKRLKENFGVIVSGVDISAIDIDKTSLGFRQLVSITKDIVGATAQAQAEAKIRDIEEKQRIEAENYAETLRIQREEGQYAAHMKTRNDNIAAYQIEKQAEVGVAGAEALGQMGANNAGGVDLGGGGMGFNPASMMASIAVGGVVGKNIANTMENAINGGCNTQVPPPIPKSEYYIAKNGAPVGPYATDKIVELYNIGEVTRDTLLWKSGMAAWMKLADISEFASFLPPPIPV